MNLGFLIYLISQTGITCTLETYEHMVDRIITSGGGKTLSTMLEGVIKAMNG